MFDAVNQDRKALGANDTNKLGDLEDLPTKWEVTKTPDMVDEENQYFQDLSKKLLYGLLPTKVAKNREKHSDSCLLVVSCDSAKGLFDPLLT